MKMLFTGYLFSNLMFTHELLATTSKNNTLIINTIGDSISTGFNSRNIGDNRDLNWGTGVAPEIDSHLKKMKTMGFIVHGYNNAKAGAKINDFKVQIDSVISNKADYVTITLGANDLCSWPANHQNQLEDFKQKFESELKRAIQLSPGIRFIISPVPNLFNLWEISRHQNQCQHRWDLFNICSPLLSSKRTLEERYAFTRRWEDLNNTLKEISSKFRDQVLFAEDVVDTTFAIDHISAIDCFHPSLAGQNLLANITWVPLESLLSSFDHTSNY